MKFTIEIISIIVGILVLLLNSYIIKKAQNIATKEDIKDITEKIETVKSKLQIETKGIIDFKAEQKQALLNFYDSFIYWYEVILDLNNTELDEDHLDDFKTYQNKITESYSKLIINEYRLQLYLANDDELLNLAHQIICNGIQLEGIVKLHLTSIYFNYEELNEYFINLEENDVIDEIKYTKIVTEIYKKEKELEIKELEIRKIIDYQLEVFIELAIKFIKIELNS